MRKTPHAGSDVHPAAKRPKKSNGNAPLVSSSAVQPAAPSADLVEKVQKLGHYPRRFKKAETDEQKAENSLAEQISKAWAKLPEDAKQMLTALKTSRASEILKEVRQLGHYPKRFMTAETDEQKAENSLAETNSKAWASLPEEDQELKTERRTQRS